MTNLSDEEVFLPTIVTETLRSQRFQVSFDDRAQIYNVKQLFGLEKQNGNVHLFIILQLNSTFRAIGKATGIKMTSKVVSKNSWSGFSVKN